MLKDRDLSILGSFHYYYSHTAKPKDREAITKERYEACEGGARRILDWNDLEIACRNNHKIQEIKHDYPIQFLYTQYLRYLYAREWLESFFDDSDKSDEFHEILEESARTASNAVQKISYMLAQKHDDEDSDIIMTIFNSKKIEDEAGMAQMIASMERHSKNKTLLNMLEELDIARNSSDVRDAMLLLLHHDSGSVMAHELRDIHRNTIRTVLRASYSRGFVFGALYAAYRFSQSIHRRFSDPGNASAIKIVRVLNKGMRHAELTLRDNFDDAPKVVKQRTGSSLARLLHERNRLRSFVNDLVDRGVVAEGEYGSVISEIRPERFKLHRHFKARIKKRFNIHIRDILHLQRIADAAPIYGYVASGATVKRLKSLGSLVYCVMTNDDNDNLCLTTAYDEAMFKKAGGILVDEMTDQQKELYIGKVN